LPVFAITDKTSRRIAFGNQYARRNGGRSMRSRVGFQQTPRPYSMDLTMTLSMTRSPSRFRKNISGFAILPTGYLVLGLLAFRASDTACATNAGDKPPSFAYDFMVAAFIFFAISE
jgi:hypothetical protein